MLDISPKTRHNISSVLMNLNEKYNLLKNNLKQMERVVVAFSGGVDSSLLLYVATEVLDNSNVIACIAVGPTQPLKQTHQARKFARTFNIKLVMITPPLMNNKKFTENSPDRCFHCKNIMVDSIQRYAQTVNINNIIFGSNLDDYDDFRPGNEALKMHNICSPLAQAELTKQDVRKLSKLINLPTADLPSNPCLVSRFEYGLEITEERLRQVEMAENYLKSLGLEDIRVRHHGNIARIEVKPNDLEKFITTPLREKTLEKFKALGFSYVTIDIEGFRTGAMNETLTPEQKEITL